MSDIYRANVPNYHHYRYFSVFICSYPSLSLFVFQGNMYCRFTSNQCWACVALSINDILYQYLYFIGASTRHCTAIMKVSVLIKRGCPGWRIAFKDIQQSFSIHAWPYSQFTCFSVNDFCHDNCIDDKWLQLYRARLFFVIIEFYLCIILICYHFLSVLVLHTKDIVTSTSDLSLCQTPLIIYLYLHLCSNTFELAVLLNFLATCNNTSISGTHTQH